MTVLDNLICSCPFGLKRYVCKHIVRTEIEYFGRQIPNLLAKNNKGRAASVSSALNK